MTVASELVRHVYVGNGENREWPFVFALPRQEYLEVWLAEARKAPVRLVSGYSVDMTGKKVRYPLPAAPGMPEPPALAYGWKLILLRAVPYTQEVDLVNQGDFNAETIESMSEREADDAGTERKACVSGAEHGLEVRLRY